VHRRKLHNLSVVPGILGGGSHKERLGTFLEHGGEGGGDVFRLLHVRGDHRDTQRLGGCLIVSHILECRIPKHADAGEGRHSFLE
jgi:hypothetical protein